jgi:CubicO group peptidase (beta-lactamase class C family)
MDASEFAVRFPETLSVFEQYRQRGLHRGMQLCVLRHGEVVVDIALGDAAENVPLRTDHRMSWLSAGKPLTVAAWARYWERGALGLDDPVAKLIPEFGNRGKERLTWRHVLTHTAGLRNVDLGWPDVTWAETIRRLCDAPLDEGAVVGVTPGYHTASTWFLLGEALQRMSGLDYPAVMQREVWEPLGITGAVTCVPDSQVSDIDVPLYERVQRELRDLGWHRSPRLTAPSPGSSLRGPIRELARFYEALRKNGDGWLTPQTVAALTARHRVGDYDQTLAHVVDFGLGLIIDSNRYGVETVPYGYGRYCSPRTFGHGGAQCSLGLCDPEAGLVVAFAFNGRPGEGQHQRRSRALSEAIYRDLGLAAL